MGGGDKFQLTTNLLVANNRHGGGRGGSTNRCTFIEFRKTKRTIFSWWADFKTTPDWIEHHVLRVYRQQEVFKKVSGMEKCLGYRRK